MCNTQKACHIVVSLKIGEYVKFSQDSHPGNKKIKMKYKANRLIVMRSLRRFNKKYEKQDFA